MRRTLTFLALGLVVVVVALLGIDTGFAIAAERSFARSLGSSTDTKIRFEPEVTLSGFPATRSIEAGRYSAIGVTARAVNVTGSGNCTATDPCHADLRSRLTDVKIVGDERFFNRYTRFDFGSMTASVTVDSVAVGRMIGIDDLTVNTPAPRDKAGGGGPQDGLLSRTEGVLLTGSVPPGPGRQKVEVSVVADLSIDGGRLRLTATDFYRGPEEHADADIAPTDRAHVLAQFSGRLPELPMPWGLTPESAHSSGSDLMIDGQKSVGGFSTMISFLLPSGPVYMMYTCLSDGQFHRPPC